MTQEEINKAAEQALASNYIMENNLDAFRQGFHLGVKWRESLGKTFDGKYRTIQVIEKIKKE